MNNCAIERWLFCRIGEKNLRAIGNLTLAYARNCLRIWGSGCAAPCRCRPISACLEAQIPASRAAGQGLGAELQLHIALDYLLPDSIGAPLITLADPVRRLNPARQHPPTRRLRATLPIRGGTVPSITKLSTRTLCRNARFILLPRRAPQENDETARRGLRPRNSHHIARFAVRW